METFMRTRAKWHTEKHDSTWDRVKDAFRRDWEQTKNDFGSDKARDLDQDIGDTFKQMSSKDYRDRYGERNYDDSEEAFRYGHAARDHYGSDHPRWNDDLSKRLREDYPHDYERDEPLIRYAYGYNYSRKR
jgi:hypothetical protein